MKNKNLLLAAVLALGLALPLCSRAQFNVYQETRAIALAGPAVIVGGGNNFVTNNWVDTHGYEGIAKIDLFGITNAAGAVSVLLEASDDQTNAIALANYSIASASSIVYSNLYYPNVIKATNNFLLPGSIVSPTAATAGFAIPYFTVASNPFTNSGSITLGSTNIVEIGYNISDAKRYVRAIWNPSGSATNFTYGALLTARKAQFP